MANRITNQISGLNLQSVDVGSALTTLHQNSEAVHNPPIIKLRVSSLGLVNPVGSWGAGTWGNGRFQASGNIQTWFNKSQSAHPMIRDITDRVVAYSRMGRHDQRVEAGVRMLCQAQDQSGGFLLYEKRPHAPRNGFLVPDTEWHHKKYRVAYFSSRCASDVFLEMFRRNRADHEIQWRALKLGLYAKRQGSMAKTNLNSRAGLIQGCVCGYLASGDREFLDCAMDYIASMLVFMDKRSGTWITPSINIFHDSLPSYAGIILKAFYHLLEALDDAGMNAQRKTVLDATVRGINHFLDQGTAHDGGQRLKPNGKVRRCKMEDSGGDYFPWELASSFKLFATSRFFSNNDKNVLRFWASVMFGAMLARVKTFPTRYDGELMAVLAAAQL